MMKIFTSLAAVGLILAGGIAARAQVGAIPYHTLARQADPSDFVVRQDSDLVSGDQVLRFGGADIPWLGLRSDTGKMADARLPTDYEIQNAFDTANAMGVSVVRSRSLAASVGCALCDLPAVDAGENETILRAADHVLKLARDNGIRLILPLAGGGGDCSKPQKGARVDGDICVYVRAHGGTDAKLFFTDPVIRAEFNTHVLTLLNRMNTETGLYWREDSAIMAFESCDDCAGDVAPALVGKWVADLAALIHAADSHHLVQNGAFASRFGRSGSPIATADFAPNGVDIVAISPDPAHLDSVLDEVTAGNRAVVMDRYDWSAPYFASVDDLDVFLKHVIKRRDLNGALLDNLSSHADQGGYLSDLAGIESGPSLYFPGIPTKSATLEDMQARARAVRRFDYNISGILVVPSFSRPARPEIVTDKNGRVVWRGTAGAVNYSIERTDDAMVQHPNWTNVCDRCVTDLSGGWQDPARGKGPAWYRVIPYDANNHLGLPSLPVESK